MLADLGQLRQRSDQACHMLVDLIVDFDQFLVEESRVAYPCFMRCVGRRFISFRRILTISRLQARRVARYFDVQGRRETHQIQRCLQVGHICVLHADVTPCAVANTDLVP